MFSKKTESAVVAAMILSAATMMITVALMLAPFKPVTYETYELAAEASCPGEAVPLRVAYVLDEEEFENIRMIDVDAEWIAEAVPALFPGATRPAGGGEIGRDMLAPGRTETGSRARYVAPDVPGAWRLYSDIEVRGTKLWLPHVQEVGIYSENTLTVLEDDDPRCEGKGLL